MKRNKVNQTILQFPFKRVNLWNQRKTPKVHYVVEPIETIPKARMITSGIQFYSVTNNCAMKRETNSEHIGYIGQYQSTFTLCCVEHFSTFQHPISETIIGHRYGVSTRIEGSDRRHLLKGCPQHLAPCNHVLYDARCKV